MHDTVEPQIEDTPRRGQPLYSIAINIFVCKSRIGDKMAGPNVSFSGSFTAVRALLIRHRFSLTSDLLLFLLYLYPLFCYGVWIWSIYHYFHCMCMCLCVCCVFTDLCVALSPWYSIHSFNLFLKYTTTQRLRNYFPSTPSAPRAPLGTLYTR